MKKGICIICEQEKEGYPVIEDTVITLLRKFKRMLGVERRNTLVVCPDDLKTYETKRKKFETLMMQMLFLSGVVLIIGIFLPILRLEFDIGRIVGSIVLAILFPALGIIMGYVPAIEVKKNASAKTGTGGKTQEQS